MPSKYNDKMFRVDRINRMEKTRLDFMIRRYDKEKISLVHEIDREKRAVVKDFAHVKRTSGFSEEGIPPSNDKDDDYKNDPVFKFGTRISEKRLNSAKSMRDSSARIHFDFNGNFKSHRNQSNSSESDDDVFITEDTVTLPLPDLSNMAEIERYEKELVESYKNVFKNTEISVKRSDKKNLTRFLRSRSQSNNRKLLRPQTAKCPMSFERQFSLPVRPATANGNASNSKIKHENGNHFDSRSIYSDKLLSRQSTSDNNLANSSGNSLRTVAEDPENQNSISPSVKQLVQQILEEESEDKDTQNVQNVTPNVQQSEQIPNISCNKAKPENGILRTKKVSASTNQITDVEVDSNGRNFRQVSVNSPRQRKVSINSVSMASELDRSVISNMWGSIGDISLDSNGQRKPSNWRKYVAADTAPIPETKRLVTLTNVVKAALAFSKTARKRALNKLIEEQSIDTRQVIQQERLRRLQSRSNILMSLSSQWSIDKDADANGPFTLMAENNI